MTTRVMTLKDSVGDWVTEHPSTARVFEDRGIDYCCGGGRDLEAACQSHDVDPQSVLAELRSAIPESEPEPNDSFTGKSLTDMCEAIIGTHHDYLRRELPRLTQLVDKVCSVHGEAHPWLSDLADAFVRLRDDLAPHMFKEERILFPAIQTIEQTQSVPQFPFGTVDNPIRMMEHEHDTAGQALRDIREATRDFTVPDDACNTFRVMINGLRELELDLHQDLCFGCLQQTLKVRSRHDSETDSDRTTRQQGG